MEAQFASRTGSSLSERGLEASFASRTGSSLPERGLEASDFDIRASNPAPTIADISNPLLASGGTKQSTPAAGEFSFLEENVNRIYDTLEPIMRVHVNLHSKLSISELATVKRQHSILKAALIADRELHRVTVLTREMINKPDDAVDPYVDPESDEEEDEEDDEDPRTIAAEKVMKEYKMYRSMINRISIEPLKALSDASVLKMKAVLDFILHNTGLSVLDTIVPSLAYHDTGSDLRRNLQYLKDEEFRHYHSGEVIVGQEPWMLKISKSHSILHEGIVFDGVSQTENLRKLTYGLSDILDLDTTSTTGCFLTGSMISAAMVRFLDRSGGNNAKYVDPNTNLFTAEAISLLYPSVYSRIKSIASHETKGKELDPTINNYRKLLNQAGGSSVQWIHDHSETYPMAGDGALLTLYAADPETMEGKVIATIHFELVDGADIDVMVCVPEGKFDEIARAQYERVRKHFPAATLTRLERPATYLWQISRIPRTIQMYRCEFPGRCVQHHMAPVRGFFSREQGSGESTFRIAPSCLGSLTHLNCTDLRYVLSKYNPADIIAKYWQRGFSVDLAYGERLYDAVTRYLKIHGKSQVRGHGITDPIHFSDDFNILQLQTSKEMFEQPKSISKRKVPKKKSEHPIQFPHAPPPDLGARGEPGMLGTTGRRLSPRRDDPPSPPVTGAPLVTSPRFAHGGLPAYQGYANPRPTPDSPKRDSSAP